jgi:hypothetical protein
MNARPRSKPAIHRKGVPPSYHRNGTRSLYSRGRLETERSLAVADGLENPASDVVLPFLRSLVVLLRECCEQKGAQ